MFTCTTTVIDRTPAAPVGVCEERGDSFISVGWVDGVNNQAFPINAYQIFARPTGNDDPQLIRSESISAMSHPNQFANQQFTFPNLM